MTVSKTTYHSSGDHYAVQFGEGAIRSLKQMGDGTEYVADNAMFAAPSWHLNGATNYRSFADMDSIEETLIREGRNYVYTAKVQDGDLAVSNQFAVSANRMTQTVTLENRSVSAQHLDGLRLAMPCQTAHRWGEKAGQKILPRAFISEHGSHMIARRCDGAMPGLVIVPAGGSAWEYMDLGSSVDEAYDNNHQADIALYFHSEERTDKHKAMESKRRHDPTSITLEPGQQAQYYLTFAWAHDEETVQTLLVEEGLATLEVVPGYTVPIYTEVKLLVTSKAGMPKVNVTDNIELLETTARTDESTWLRFRFLSLGQHEIHLEFPDGRMMYATFFATEAVETLVKKRAAFIAKQQVEDPQLWYNGLLCEWNNRTGVILTPDEYDDIEGWRRYAVTCDDPGLSKPAYLSSKQTAWPEQEEINALDAYLDDFVWGGLQKRDDEDYPYGIYGITDWYQNRNSEDKDIGGQEHIWRVYDYPHLFLTYYNMYYVAKYHPDVTLRHSKETYLKKAYHTAVTMFTLPLELVTWSAYETGFYNELVIEDIIKALEQEGQSLEARRLRRHWDRKVDAFMGEDKDIFGSEYPFDTTGFESTQALGNRAVERILLEEVKQERPDGRPKLTPAVVHSFLQRQANANMACRGRWEATYWDYGSDYRGNNYKYLLSYMSQMGGQALLDYAFTYIEDYETRCAWLRVAYGSLQSSWALVNSGTEETDYGYWFPGPEHDGAASGGFEPLPYGETWLGPKHQFGPWYYSCEIDLGFCGGLRGASSLIVDDPAFGLTGYGAELDENDGAWHIVPTDALRKRIMIVTREHSLSVDLGFARMPAEGTVGPAVFTPTKGSLTIRLEGPIDPERFMEQVKVSPGYRYNLVERDGDYDLEIS